MKNLCISLTLLVIIFFLSTLPTSLSQPKTQIQTIDPSTTCNGVFVKYSYSTTQQLPPNLTASDPSHQPYKFESSLFVLNNGLKDLKSWRAYVGFQHGELLVSASNAVLVDGSSLPANVSNGTVLAGYPMADLKTAVETAGDLTQMSITVDLVGTEFGVKSPNVPMPSNISLANDGFICPNPTTQGNIMYTCCTLDPNAKSIINATDEQFLPRQKGDVSIIYDILSTYDTNYWAQVTISNENPTSRIDYWQITWEWMREEFIYAMRGASPDRVDQKSCIFGKQGEYYKSPFDFSKALTCDSKPTIIDLPPSLAKDPTIGNVPYCCRNGSLLPYIIDPSLSISAFQMQVYKMPPDLNLTIFNPPQNWKINGTYDQDYQCGNPIRVTPSLVPSDNGLPVQEEVIATWQVVCNKTRTSSKPPKCCVTFSSFFNESVIPCNTCACGCPNTQLQTCNASAPALLLPSDALLIPFENRTKIAIEYANMQHTPLPNVLPCGDNCGFSIHWHLNTDYRDGWSSKITIFNWEEDTLTDWFLAVEIDKGGPGSKVYSFNYSSLPGDQRTIFMNGFQGYNGYLLGESNGTNPDKDPKVPGSLQSVISFKKTQGIDVGHGDGFPSKVIFNGEECSLPTILPVSSDHNMVNVASGKYRVLLLSLVLMFLLW